MDMKVWIETRRNLVHYRKPTFRFSFSLIHTQIWAISFLPPWNNKLALAVPATIPRHFRKDSWQKNFTLFQTHKAIQFYRRRERDSEKSAMEDETRVATARVRTTQTLVFSNHKQTPTRYSINNTDCARKQWQTIDVFVSYDNLWKMGQKQLVKYEISFFIVLLALQCYEWRFGVIFTSLPPLLTSGHDDSSILATFSK